MAHNRAPSTPRSHLRQHRRSWVYRRRVPQVLRQVTGFPCELLIPLRTRRLRLARRRADQLDSLVGFLVVEARAGRRRMADGRSFEGWMQEMVARLAAEWLNDSEERRVARRDPIDEDELERDAGGFSDLVIGFRRDLALNTIPDAILKRADELIREHGVAASLGRDVSEIERRLLARRLMQAQVDVWVVEERRLFGDYSDVPALAVPSTSISESMTPAGTDTGVPAKGNGPALADAVEAYLKDGGRTWRPRTAANARSVLERFVQAIGPKRPLSSLTKQDVRGWREAMLAAGISAKTANEYVGRYVGGFWNWAVKNDHAGGANPAKGLAIRVRQSPKDERNPFTNDELAKIFGGDYGQRTGPARGRGASKHGPADHWLPLIMLHTGCRPEEVAQLRLADVEELEGVLCFRIRAEAEDQNVKTPGSWRDVPVHSFLVELGLMQYVARVKQAGGVRLFPELSNTGGRGYVEQVGKRFHRRLRTLGITDHRKVLYSFRHTFQDRLYHADVQETVIARLMGHTVEGETFGRYGGPVRPGKLRDAVERLDFRAHLSAVSRLLPSPGPL